MFLPKRSVRTFSRFIVFLGWYQYHGLGKKGLVKCHMSARQVLTHLPTTPIWL